MTRHHCITQERLNQFLLILNLYLSGIELWERLIIYKIVRIVFDYHTGEKAGCIIQYIIFHFKCTFTHISISVSNTKIEQFTAKYFSIIKMKCTIFFNLNIEQKNISLEALLKAIYVNLLILVI